MAVIGRSLKQAERLVAIGPLQVIQHEEVQEAVIVHVHPGSGNGPQRAEFRVATLVQSRFLRDIGERAVAVVVIQRIPVNARDKQVGVAVVVVIAGSHADVKAGTGQTGGIGNICKNTFAVVTEQTVSIFWRVLLQSGDVGAISEEDVGPAIAVVVEDRDTAGHSLRSITSRRLVAVELKSDGLIGEPDGGRSSSGGEEKKCARSEEHTSELQSLRHL